MMAPGMPGLRRMLSRLHLWTGLSVGLLFALLGLSGAVLVVAARWPLCAPTRRLAEVAQSPSGERACRMPSSSSMPSSTR